MNLLMIAYEFPPAAAGGVMRTVKHCKYLPQFGWRPHVLTPKAPAIQSSDLSLLREIGSDTRVHRCGGWECDKWLARMRRSNSRWSRAIEWRLRRCLQIFAKPDPMRLWATPALLAGLQICRRHHIDAIYSTSWPFSDHWAGLWLHRLTGLPWVADFRDPWLQHYNYGIPSSRRDRWNRRLESQICRQAAFVVSATSSATQALRQSHAELDPARFVTIRNGFDSEDFHEEELSEPSFSIVHLGSFYGSRNPSGFWKGIGKFLEAVPEARRDLHITFAGSTKGPCGAAPSDVQWKHLPWISHRQAVRIMKQSAVLLLVQHRESAVGLTVPGKLYEYMASGKHILCLNIQPGENAGLLRGYRNSTLLWDDRPNHVAAALEVLYRRYRSGSLQIEPRMNFVHRFTRIASSERLASLLHSAVAAVRSDGRQFEARRYPRVSESMAPSTEGLLCRS